MEQSEEPRITIEEIRKVNKELEMLIRQFHKLLWDKNNRRQLPGRNRAVIVRDLKAFIKRLDSNDIQGVS